MWIKHQPDWAKARPTERKAKMTVAIMTVSFRMSWDLCERQSLYRVDQQVFILNGIDIHILHQKDQKLGIPKIA